MALESQPADQGTQEVEILIFEIVHYISWNPFLPKRHAV